MKISLTDIRSVIKPLSWFLVFQFIVFMVLIVLPQGNDIYINLFEDGFWANSMPASLIFVALFYICCTSGIGAKFLTAIHPIQINPSNGDRISTGSILKWVVNFLWYFPLLVFLVGFLKVSILNFHLFAFSGIVWTIFFTIITFFAIQKSRSLLRKYLELGIENQILLKSKGIDGLTLENSKNSLLRKFDGLDSIFPKEIKDAKQKLNYIRDYYPPLLKILSGVFTFSVLISVILAFLPIDKYYYIGAVALVIFGMGTWITLYYCVEIFDKIYKIRITENVKFINLKMIIFLWFCFCSIKANHKVRLSNKVPISNFSDKTVNQSLKDFTSLDSTETKYVKTDSLNKPPIIFVDVDGGASRTGLFGALMLSTINDSCPDFKRRIFGYSSISGGTLGANFFQTLSPDSTMNEVSSYSENTKKFFLHDFISPLIGTFMFGELFGYFIPFSVEKFDRGIALEKSWESSFENLYKDKKERKFSRPLLEVLNPKGSKFNPIMLINSYEIETGNRAILSNIKLEEKYFSGITNLNEFIEKPIPFSSAIHMSARFPIISPSAELSNGNMTRHFGDGGYFETSGTLSLYELIKANEDSLRKNYNVYVVHCQYNDDHTEEIISSNNFFTEIMDIISGAINDHSGLTYFSNQNLKSYITNKMGGPDHYIELNVGNNDTDVPLNWVLSKKAVEMVNNKCRYHLNNNKNLQNLLKNIQHYDKKNIASNK